MDKSFTEKMGYTSPFNESSDDEKPIIITSDKAILAKIKQEKKIKEEAEKQQDEGGEIKENQKNSTITVVNKKGTKLNQVQHEFVNVGESIAQIKRTTTAGFTKKGTVFVSQFRSQVASRGEEVWAYKNDCATFEGTLEQAKKEFPDIDFTGLDPKYGLVISPEVDPNIEIPPDSPLVWHPLIEFDAERDNKGKPTNWNAYLDATQTAIDLIGLIPIVGDAADIINGTISLARGNYSEAAINFASAIPVAGVFIGGAKIIKKVAKTAEDNKGVYDLMVKNADEVRGYVGRSNDVYKRFIQHFGKSGKLNQYSNAVPEIIYKMAGSTKLEQEIYEQFIIITKYKGKISKGNEVNFLLNKVNPIGGRFKIKDGIASPEFYKEAFKIIEKYKLPKTFN